MGVPTLEVMVGDRTYFTDPDGKRWRVYDATIASRRLQVHRPPSGAAAVRVFVGADGVRRCHRFDVGDARTLNVRNLEQQLRASSVTREAPRRLGWAEQQSRREG
jgi:hypothetical protein